MTKVRRTSLKSVALGALLGTAAFYGVMAVLQAGSMEEAALPTAFQTLGIYLFFFAVMWLSRRPFSNMSA
jgi:hypothetical protein